MQVDKKPAPLDTRVKEEDEEKKYTEKHRKNYRVPVNDVRVVSLTIVSSSSLSFYSPRSH